MDEEIASEAGQHDGVTTVNVFLQFTWNGVCLLDTLLVR